MADENKEVINVKPQSKEKIAWKTVWVACGIMLCVLILFQGIVAGCRYVAGQIREFKDYQNQRYDRQENDGPDFRFEINRNRGDYNPFEERRDGSFGGMFRESLPPNATADKIKAIADAFRRASENEYRNKAELLADLNRALQGTCGKEWIPFFKAILAKASEEGVNSAEEMKSFLIRTADELVSAREPSVLEIPPEVGQPSLPAADTPPSCPSPAADQPEPEPKPEEVKEEPKPEETKPAEEPKPKAQSPCVNGQCGWR